MAVKIIAQSNEAFPRQKRFPNVKALREAVAKKIVGTDWNVRYSDNQKSVTAKEFLQKYSGEIFEKKSSFTGSKAGKEELEKDKIFKMHCQNCGEKILFECEVGEINCFACNAAFQLKILSRKPQIFLLIPEKNSAEITKIDELQNALKILKIKDEINPEILKKAYRLAMKENHPDLVANMSKEIQDFASDHSAKINIAYNFLLKQF